MILILSVLLSGAMRVASTAAPPADMVYVEGGSILPLYQAGKDRDTVRVESFWMDRAPVTRAQFREFLVVHQEWRKSRAPNVFRDAGYLASWSDDLTPPLDATEISRPVTEVSWFAARAFCARNSKRLPSTIEWEFAADPPSGMAGSKRAAPVMDLGWYESSSHMNEESGGWGPPDARGFVFLHRQWEWVEDFNSSLVTGDNRGDTDLDRNLFCGGAAAEGTDRSDYAAFMRYATRSSLDAAYSTRDLGFRCAKDGTQAGVDRK